MNLLISACLLGCHCRYDGGDNCQPWVEALAGRHRLVPVCPEQLGGLSTPRSPAELLGERMFTDDGDDVTAAFVAGAAEALRLAQLLDCQAAVLKERSPSCGAGCIYDGSFTHTKVPKDGMTAALLRQNGIAVYGESQVEALLEKPK